MNINASSSKNATNITPGNNLISEITVQSTLQTRTFTGSSVCAARQDVKVVCLVLTFLIKKAKLSAAKLLIYSL